MIVATRGGALRPTEPGVHVHPGGAEPREVATIGLGGAGPRCGGRTPGPYPCARINRNSLTTRGTDTHRRTRRRPTRPPAGARRLPPPFPATDDPPPAKTPGPGGAGGADTGTVGRKPSAVRRPPSAVRDAIGRRQRRSRIEGDPAIGIERRPAPPHRTESLAENRTAAWWRLDVAPDERSGPRATGHRRTAPDDPVRRWRAVAPTVRTRADRADARRPVGAPGRAALRDGRAVPTGPARRHRQALTPAPGTGPRSGSRCAPCRRRPPRTPRSAPRPADRGPGRPGPQRDRLPRGHPAAAAGAARGNPDDAGSDRGLPPSQPPPHLPPPAPAPPSRTGEQAQALPARAGPRGGPCGSTSCRCAAARWGWSRWP